MDDLLSVLRIQLAGLLAVIPNLIQAIAIFLVGWILASVVAKLTKSLLKTIGADRLADRLNEIDLIERSRIRLVPSRLFSRILYYIILFIFLMAAVNALGMESVSLLMADIINYLPKALSAFLVLIFGLIICDFIKRLVLTTSESLGIPASRLIANAVFYFLFLNVIMITLKQADLQTEFMENNISIILGGVIAAFAIGYGLASRDLMANLLSSFYNRDRIRIGDEITIEGVRGRIVEMDNISMTLQTEDARIIVPLSKLTTHHVAVHRRPPPDLPTPPAVL